MGKAEGLCAAGGLPANPPIHPPPTHPHRCIDVHGPEGRRGVRGLAFTADGRLLLGAYPDGLRTFSLDPLAHQGSADVAWSKVGGRTLGAGWQRGGWQVPALGGRAAGTTPALPPATDLRPRPLPPPRLQVQSVRYTDGKAMAISLFKGDAEVHCIDLTRLQPRSGAAAAVPAGGGGGSGSLSAGTSGGLASGGRLRLVSQLPCGSTLHPP